MSTAAIDANGRQTFTGRLNTDGVTPTRVKADPSTHAMSVEDSATGTDQGGSNAATDANDRPTFIAVSSADGKSPLALYVNSSGQLLIKST